jgi:predicted molibdopterin-dependent oxidoreductase YjgC
LIQDFIVPQEEIKFQSSSYVKVGGKNYRLILTNGRILLYAQRGRITKNEDVVMTKLDELQGITYKEKGLIRKQGVIEIQGTTFLQLSGTATEIKPLYKQLMQFCLK